MQRTTVFVHTTQRNEAGQVTGKFLRPLRVHTRGGRQQRGFVLPTMGNMPARRKPVS